ncbi:MAG: AmmeMemoRadiSam system protein B [Treponema sp.]|jgi:AmmeMemoRadiSam system protein B|nr:AmmeMemoRadiSam system protein B [Treponema sp.]
MKKPRKPRLPPGWYPQNPEAVKAFLDGAAAPGPVCAAAAPHAGWYYSGEIAAKAAAALAGPSGGGWEGTVAVIGGHLPGGSRPLFAAEDAVITPFGELELDTALRDALARKTGGGEDTGADNTVEVLVPMVHFFFPRARLLWVRFPADVSSFEAGKTLALAAAALKREVKVLGSTDLTHYGANYGFAPRGFGKNALEWVKNVNDRRFIEAVTGGDPGEILARAEREHSACSAGAVLGALGFAAESAAGKVPPLPGIPSARLLAYETSAARAVTGEIPDSFVGYAAFAWI